MIRHRAGCSYSIESARYRKYREEKFYIPEDLNEEWKSLLVSASDSCWHLYDRVIESHEELGLTRGRAKEIARYFLPLSTQVELVATYNMRSFLHFLKLRDEKHAQVEIRQVAQQMRALVEETERFKHSFEAHDLKYA
jgi:thymidylate synthase (FAD)